MLLTLSQIIGYLYHVIMIVSKKEYKYITITMNYHPITTEIVLFTVKKKLLLNCEEITKTSRKYVYTFFIVEKSSEKHTLILFAFLYLPYSISLFPILAKEQVKTCLLQILLIDWLCKHDPYALSKCTICWNIWDIVNY